MDNYEQLRREIQSSSTSAVKVLIERRSVRVFTDERISPVAKRTILFAASEAPTSSCQQLYTVIDVTDNEIKRSLSECCGQPFIAGAPMILLFCGDSLKWYAAFGDAGCKPRAPGVGELVLSAVDSAIAAQNAVTAAWSMGIGSCYIGDVLENCEKVRDILKLPDFVIPAAMVVFGYPTAHQLQRPKPLRVPLESNIFQNAYPERTGEDYRTMFAEKKGNMSYEDWMKQCCANMHNSVYAVEMTRSVEEYMKPFLK